MKLTVRNNFWILFSEWDFLFFWLPFLTSKFPFGTCMHTYVMPKERGYSLI